MLPREVRMRSSVDFSTTTRRGRRTARRSLVLHSDLLGAPGIKVGFVVSKAVGNAVTRNRVKRRLRHLVSARLAAAPDGLRLVVRALPAAADAVDLESELNAAWSSAEGRGWVRNQPTRTGAAAAT